MKCNRNVALSTAILISSWLAMFCLMTGESFVVVVVVRYPASSSSSSLMWKGATAPQTSQAIHRGHKNDDDLPSDDATTYYSPNVALDETRYYRYDDSSEQFRNDQDDTSLPDSSVAASVNEYSFFDEAIIYVRAGSGGQGASTYRKGVNNQNGPPDGGNGGRGGSVVMMVDESLNTLAGLTNAWRPNAFGGSGGAATQHQSHARFFKSFRAENGRDGERQFKNGRYGKDTVIRVPPGTVVQEEVEYMDDQKNETVVQLVDIGSLTLNEPELVAAQGGEGGEGSGVASGGRGVKRPRVPPTGGERKKLKLTLKIVADVAIVAVPNAGKSTLLAAVTRAKPKIANYPFTTVIPNLGVWVPPEAGLDGYSMSDETEGGGSSGLVLCDVPGLIAGAAKGVGLGHAFLRHVERCHVILHLVDATSNDPIADYQMINREILNYGSGQLAKMPQVVVVNKIDAFDEGSGEEWEAGLKTRLARDELEAKLKDVMSHSRLMWMSAKEREGVDDLMKRLAAFVHKVKETKQ